MKNKVATEDKNQDALAQVLARLEAIEDGLETVKRTIADAGISSGPVVPKAKATSIAAAGGSIEGKVIEGMFDGQNMIGDDGKTYHVKANYASKSMLVQGDRLKLTIMDDGTFIFKQINPVARKSLIGILKLENDQYVVTAGGKDYNVLYASVTHYKLTAGDEVTISVPADGDAQWAAIEAVIS